jgi:general secretion pathway protein M
MKSYLNTLNERERWMAIGAGICLILYVYYLALYAPLKNQVIQKSEQLIEKTQTLSFMKQVSANPHKAAQKKVLNNSQLLTMLASQLKENESFGFPYQLQQTNTGDIQLSFDAIPFALFIDWLYQMNKHYLVSIKQLEVEHTDKPGVAHLMIVISGSS